jgi:hypothetical protein
MKGFFLLMCAAALWGWPAVAQESRFEVADLVDIPHILTGGRDPSWYLEFREQWTLSPGRPSIQKTVRGYTVHDHQDPRADKDSLQSEFEKLLRYSVQVRGTGRFSEISSEFMLMEPVDTVLEALQKELAGLVERYSASSSHYDLPQQLLSVDFHEEWTVDAVSCTISKRVLAMTPEIWQRRETTDGQPVDDRETGLPVYYKVKLERIPLRNP